MKILKRISIYLALLIIHNFQIFFAMKLPPRITADMELREIYNALSDKREFKNNESVNYVPPINNFNFNSLSEEEINALIENKNIIAELEKNSITDQFLAQILLAFQRNLNRDSKIAQFFTNFKKEKEKKRILNEKIMNNKIITSSDTKQKELTDFDIEKLLKESYLDQPALNNISTKNLLKELKKDNLIKYIKDINFGNLVYIAKHNDAFKEITFENLSKNKSFKEYLDRYIKEYTDKEELNNALSKDTDKNFNKYLKPLKKEFLIYSLDNEDDLINILNNLNINEFKKASKKIPERLLIHAIGASEEIHNLNLENTIDLIKKISPKIIEKIIKNNFYNSQKINEANNKFKTTLISRASGPLDNFIIRGHFD